MATYDSDYGNFRDATYGLYAATDDSDRALLNTLTRGSFTFQKFGTEAANAATSSAFIYVPQHTIRILGGTFTSPIAAIADNTDYAQFVLGFYTTTAAFTLVTTWNTTVANGNIVANVPWTIGLSEPSSQWIVPAFKPLIFVINKQGAGVVLDRGLVQFEYELVSL